MWVQQGTLCITSDATWGSWHLKSLAAWLSVQQFVKANNRVHTKVSHYWSFVRGIHRSHRWILLTKGQLDSPYKGPVMWKVFPFHDTTISMWQVSLLIPSRIRKKWIMVYGTWGNISMMSVIAEKTNLKNDIWSNTEMGYWTINVSLFNDCNVCMLHMRYIAQQSQLSQHGGCWWPGTTLVPGHLQPSWWPQSVVPLYNTLENKVITGSGNSLL